MILIADSGSTKTDWCVAEKDNVMLRIATQGINPFHQDEATIEAIIGNELLPQMAEVTVGGVYFYGSGCRDEFVPMMTRIFSRAFPDASVIEAHGDLLGAARAVCGTAEGIACILGTGANSCLYDGRHIVMNTPPLGYILGDEGSGAVLGRLFINALFKGLPDGGGNGISAVDEFRDMFMKEYGLTMADIIRRVYREPMANRFLASFAPFIHRHRDEPWLHAIIVDNFRTFFRRNVVQYGRRDLAVGAVGSIAWYFSDELNEAAHAEGFSMGRIVRSPLYGLVSTVLTD